MRPDFSLGKVQYLFHTEDKDISLKKKKIHCIIIISWNIHRHHWSKTARIQNKFFLTLSLTLRKVTLTFLIITMVSHLTGHLEDIEK